MIWLINIIIILILVELIIYLKLKNIFLNSIFLSKNLLHVFIKKEEKLELKQAYIFENLKKLLKIYLNLFKNIFIVFLLFIIFEFLFNYDLKNFIFNFLEFKFIVISTISVIIYLKLRNLIIEKF